MNEEIEYHHIHLALLCQLRIVPHVSIAIVIELNVTERIVYRHHHVGEERDREEER